MSNLISPTPNVTLQYGHQDYPYICSDGRGVNEFRLSYNLRPFFGAEPRCDWGQSNLYFRLSDVRHLRMRVEQEQRDLGRHQSPTCSAGKLAAFSKCKPSFGIGILPNKKISQRLARFRQINLDNAATHHDALEFADGQVILLTRLCEGQHATVLQLPAAARTAEEVGEQKRVSFVV